MARRKVIGRNGYAKLMLLLVMFLICVQENCHAQSPEVEKASVVEKVKAIKAKVVEKTADHFKDLAGHYKRKGRSHQKQADTSASHDSMLSKSAEKFHGWREKVNKQKARSYESLYQALSPTQGLSPTGHSPTQGVSPTQGLFP